jgi:hypothetical protein
MLRIFEHARETVPSRFDPQSASDNSQSVFPHVSLSVTSRSGGVRREQVTENPVFREVRRLRGEVGLAVQPR